MALRTLGTNATTSLSAILWPALGAPPVGSNTPADRAAMAALLRSDNVNNSRIPNASIDQNGLLHYPEGRGTLIIKPGDYVAIDSTGWPILLSANAILSGPWTHT